MICRMRMEAQCRGLIRKKYPGLPDYFCPCTDVYRIIAYGTEGKSYPEETIRTARELETLFSLNSGLSTMIGRPLDWMHEMCEAEYFINHVEEYESLCAVYDGKLQSFRFIASELEKRHAHAVHVHDDGTLMFDCIREEMDTSDKWSPSLVKVDYTVMVKPNNMDAFLKKLSELKVNPCSIH
ncbi:MAG: hypothetical protein ACI4NM_08680 [Bullifex sp.]